MVLNAPDQGGTRVRATVRTTADADPSVVARIAHQLNLSNVVQKVFLMVTEPDGVVHVESILEGLPAGKGDLIHRKIMQLTCVISVDVLVTYCDAERAATELAGSDVSAIQPKVGGT